MIERMNEDDDFGICAEVIRRSFATVAQEFSLTRDNAPTNPAFITDEQVLDSARKGAEFFGLRIEGKICGCVAVEKSGRDDGLFFIERLAVIPELRHRGYGTILLDHAFGEIRRRNGTVVSIGIMDCNTRLKEWYVSYGFTITEKRDYPHLPFRVCFMEKGI